MKPRLTSRVIRGLAQILASVPPDLRVGFNQDAIVAEGWIVGINAWARAPKRKQAMPAHLAKLMKLRRRKRR